MGTLDGGIYLFDPIIRGKGDVKRFNQEFDLPIAKKKTVDIVKWLDSPTE